MILYIEKKARDYPQAQKLLQKFQRADIVWIDHYKNIFDKKTAGLWEQKSIIIAKLESPVITPAPSGYGHSSDAYFFKTSLGCVFDCDYCFLKGAFKTEHMVFFVNYDDIKAQIQETIESHQTGTNLWFYSSDYSDIQGMDVFSNFTPTFIEFFEWFPGVNMEIRTKSWNIKSLLALGFTPKNTEIAFSLNPQELIEAYETGTASLTQRIRAINTLLEAGWRVWIRLLPLLPVKNYKEIYGNFFAELQDSVDLKKCDSLFASGLLYTKNDYKKIIKKYPNLDILYHLSLESDDFFRSSREVREWFYHEIKKLDQRCLLCLEN